MLQVTYYDSSASCWPCRMRCGGRGGSGGKFPKQNKPDTLPSNGGEVGACKDLEGNVFTIGKIWRYVTYLQGEVGTL
jgi:hypothetical protein